MSVTDKDNIKGGKAFDHWLSREKLAMLML